MSEQRATQPTQRTQQNYQAQQAVTAQEAAAQQAAQQNQPMGINEALATLMSKVQSIDGSMRRQSGDIAQLKNKLLENQSIVESAQTNNEQITRQEFNKAINYVCNEIAKQATTHQQALSNDLRQIKHHLESINTDTTTSNKTSGAKANLTQNIGQNKVMGLFGGQASVKVSLPLIGNVQLPLPIPIKFIKPAAITGLVLFALIIMFLGSR
jgi:hypothetical protein